MFVSSAAVGYIIMTLVILYFFSYGLFKITLAVHNTVRNLDNIRVNKHQEDLINATSKYSILVLCSLITAVVISIISVLRSFTSEIEFWRFFFYYTYFVLAMIDSVINVFCLFVQFKFYGNENYYRLCKKPHEGFKGWVQKYAEKKIKQNKLTSMSPSAATNIQGRESSSIFSLQT